MIGIIADDITGANDIGMMFAKSGLITDVYPLEKLRSGLPDVLPDVLVIDTNSRLDSPDLAYRKVYTAAVALRAAGCRQLINKTCSVFRGNIGAEFDALLDAVLATFAVVVLGFPKNGRTTIDGAHYVHGKPLADSEFRSDPVHPMKESDLVAILQSQTERNVALLPIGVVEQGAAALREAIEKMRGQCTYLILDVRDQQSLRVIAEAVRDELILCGSSGLYEEWAALVVKRDGNRTSHIDGKNRNDNARSSSGYSEAAAKRSGNCRTDNSRSGNKGSQAAVKLGVPVHDSRRDLPPSGSKADRQATGVLCAAGSLMPQTAAQIEYAKQSGMIAVELDSLKLLRPDMKEVHLQEIVEQASLELTSGRDVLLHASNDPGKVDATRLKAEELGMSRTELSRLVSEALSEAVERVASRARQKRLVIAGGETSAAVCGLLGIEGLRLLEEIEPGLPSCMSLDGSGRLLVLKSGSFGSDAFIVKAIKHLKEFNNHGESDSDERDL